jgi:glycosyltransferase involved in cell wall biosynthesis
VNVLILAARAFPNDGGIYTIIKPIVESLLAQGSFNYTFLVNQTQGDIESLVKERNRPALSYSDFGRITRLTRWLDGSHPRFPGVDRLRDRFYQTLPSGWTLGKYCYGKELSQSRWDVCHSLFQSVPFWPQQKGLVYINNAYDFQPEYLPEFAQKEAQQKAEIKYAHYRNASALCVLGDTVKDDAIRFAGIDPERIFVMPLGPWPMPPPADEAFREVTRKKFALPQRFMFYPAASRIAKNHSTLIKAIAELKRKGCPVNLVTTIKQEPHYSYLTSLITDLGVEENVLFTGFLDPEEVGALYDLTDFVILPTLFEGATGIPLLEASAKGKAIAAARVCEIPHALGENGIIFDPLSVSEIASAIEKLWCDNQARTYYEDKSFEVSRNRSWEFFARQCEKAYTYAQDNPKQ